MFHPSLNQVAGGGRGHAANGFGGLGGLRAGANASWRHDDATASTSARCTDKLWDTPGRRKRGAADGCACKMCDSRHAHVRIRLPARTLSAHMSEYGPPELAKDVVRSRHTKEPQVTHRTTLKGMTTSSANYCCMAQGPGGQPFEYRMAFQSAKRAGRHNYMCQVRFLTIASSLSLRIGAAMTPCDMRWFAVRPRPPSATTDLTNTWEVRTPRPRNTCVH